MKTESHPLKISLLVFALFICFSPFTAIGQTYTLNNGTSTLEVLGTSSLHDWEIKAEKQSGSITIDKASETPAIKTLTFEVVSESLKSGKSGMDKNTYNALKTNKYKTITFKLTDIKSITASGGDKYAVKAIGDLSIAGITNKINLDFTLDLSNSQAKLMGEYGFKMTHFKIDPPTAMFGTITTGDELKVKFSTVFNQ